MGSCEKDVGDDEGSSVAVSTKDLGEKANEASAVHDEECIETLPTLMCGKNPARSISGKNPGTCGSLTKNWYVGCHISENSDEVLGCDCCARSQSVLHGMKRREDCTDRRYLRVGFAFHPNGHGYLQY